MELKRFLWISFFTRSYQGLNFWENRVISVDFHIFENFFTKISLILLKFEKFFIKKVLLIIFLETNNIVGSFSFTFLSKILAKYFKILFYQKQHELIFLVNFD